MAKPLEQFADVMEELKGAFGGAVNRQRRLSGQQTDPALYMYDKLTPDDIDTIVATFGLTDTEDWIRRMEAKRSGIDTKDR
jgi:hypothetical protein